MAALQYQKGDLLASPEPLIAHGCNSQGVMGAGIAAAIKARFPAAFQAYRLHHEMAGLQLGQVIFVDITPSLTVANAITQATTGTDPQTRYVSYDAIADCMTRIAAEARFRRIGRVGLPKIGAGLANGDWSIIERIIERQLVASGVTAAVYEL